MAAHLDLEEQEQLEQLKAFWKRWGTLITGLLTLALLAYAGWTGWNMWQRDQAGKAASVFAELERAAQGNDLEKAQTAFTTLKDDFGTTGYAAQGALLAAKVQMDQGKADEARASLTWAADQARGDAYRDLARLRLAALQMDSKQYDEATKLLSAVKGADFAPLVADRRGDLAMLQGKPDDAKAEYRKAWDGLDKQLDYRHLVSAKLASLGVAVPDAAASGAAQ